jgi:hypothetical protein
MTRKNKSARAWARQRRRKKGWVGTIPPRTACGKVGYRDKLEALAWMGRIAARRAEHGNEHVEKRAFMCFRCHRWHLTSQPQRTDAPW